MLSFLLYLLLGSTDFCDSFNGLQKGGAHHVWIVVFLGDPGFFGLIFLVLLLSILVGLPMFLLQLFSGEKIKFFGLKPGEPIYDANRHT